MQPGTCRYYLFVGQFIEAVVMEGLVRGLRSRRAGSFRGSGEPPETTTRTAA